MGQRGAFWFALYCSVGRSGWSFDLNCARSGPGLSQYLSLLLEHLTGLQAFPAASF